MRAKRVRWVVELDYNADPENDGESVRQAIKDELVGAKGKPEWIDNAQIIFDTMDDVFACKMRFNDHVVRIGKFKAVNL